MYKTDYAELNKMLESLISGHGRTHADFIADLANASALLMSALEDINWAGFYLVDGQRLILGPFQGKVACWEIAFGKGVCGTAWMTGETQLVPDVHAFPGHIACDAASRSEIVVPLRTPRGIIGVLDIDSPSESRFTEEDRAGLEAFARIIEGQKD